MARKIPQAFIDELMRRVDIVDVIESRMALRKAGRDYQALCPFHDEKSPSFTVSSDKQFYHCFGCGAHGTALGFLMAYENMDFPEAVEELARAVGMEVPREPGSPPDQPARSDRELYALLEQVATYYRRQLRDHAQASRAVEYLKSRGITGRTAADFELGYAPAGWDGALKAIGTTAALRAQLAQTGILVEKPEGGYYDRFRDRVMFPIRDHRGRIVGFGGRVIGDDMPKYLNSPETPLFHKGRELYGYYQARQADGHPPRLLVVEGYMDVISLAQHGIRSAVATLGTATTAEHLSRLYRTTPEVVFCFDGDRAGREAAWRAMQAALPFMREGAQARFMFLPEGEDPDTLVQKGGKAAFEQRIAHSVSLSTFLFEGLCAQADISSMDGRARLVELARPLLSKIPTGVYRHLAMARLAELARMEPAAAEHLAGGRAPAVAPPPGRAPSAPRRSAPSPVRLALALLVQRPQLALRAGDARRFRELAVPGAALLAQMIEVVQASPDLTPAGLLERWRGNPEAAHLEKLAAWRHPTPEDGYEAEFLGSLARLDQQRAARIKESLFVRLGDKAPSELTPEEKASLLQKLKDSGSAT